MLALVAIPLNGLRSRLLMLLLPSLAGELWRHGATLTWQSTLCKIGCSLTAFAAILGERCVVTWSIPYRGGNGSAVPVSLRHVQ